MGATLTRSDLALRLSAGSVVPGGTIIVRQRGTAREAGAERWPRQGRHLVREDHRTHQVRRSRIVSASSSLIEPMEVVQRSNSRLRAKFLAAERAEPRAPWASTGFILPQALTHR